MSDFTSPADFAAKAVFEGGILEALEYGLHASELDPADEASAALREVWAELEAIWRDRVQPLIRKAEAILEAFDQADEDIPNNLL